jgi:hypothetical protein
VKRIQIYLDEYTWKLLNIRARQNSMSISKLVRSAVHEKYGDSLSVRTQAMQAVVGLWKDRSDLPDTDIYLHRLRKGKRLTKISF